MTVQIKKKPQGCYAIPHSASEAEDDSMGKKKAEKKAFSGCSFIYTVSASNLPLIRFVIAHFFFSLQGAVKSIFVTTLVTPYHPLSADRRPFFFSPFSISIQYSLGNFTYLKIIIDFLAIGFGSCGFWCRCKTHFMIHLYHVK